MKSLFKAYALIPNFLEYKFIPSSEAMIMIEQFRRSPPIIDYNLFVSDNNKNYNLYGEINSVVQLQPYSTWEDRSEPIELPSHGVFFFSPSINVIYSDSLKNKINQNESNKIYETKGKNCNYLTVYPKASITHFEDRIPFFTSFGEPNCLFKFYRSCFGKALRYLMYVLPTQSIYSTLFLLSFNSLKANSEIFISDKNEFSVQSGNYDLKTKVFETEDKTPIVPQIKEIEKNIDYNIYGFDPERYFFINNKFEKLAISLRNYIKMQYQPFKQTIDERMADYELNKSPIMNLLSNLYPNSQQQMVLSYVHMSEDKGNQYQNLPIQQQSLICEEDSRKQPLLSSPYI